MKLPLPTEYPALPYPLMLQLGGLLSHLAPGQQVSNYAAMSVKFFAQGNNNTTKVATPGIEPTTF